MKLTKKSTKTEIETTESVCEITKDEFEQICAGVAAHTVVETIGDDPDVDDVMAGLALTRIFAKLCTNLTDKLFTDPNENNDEKEEN